MNPRNRGIIVGMSGFFAGMLVAQVVPWSTGSRAILVIAVAMAVSGLILVLTRPRSDS